MGKRKKKVIHNQRIFDCPNLEIERWITQKTNGAELVTTQVKKDYFSELYPLFLQTQWQQLPPYGKVIFFGRWFYAVSNSYIKEFKKREIIEKNIDEYKSIVIPLVEKAMPALVKAAKKDVSNDIFIQELKDCLTVEQTDGYYCLDGQALIDIPFNKNNRNRFLSENIGIASLTPVTRPSKQEDLSRIKRIIEADTHHKTGVKYGYGEIKTKRITKGDTYPPEISETIESYESFDGLKLFLIDIRFPIKTILCHAEKILKDEQKNYFNLSPEEKPFFLKETRDGRLDTYPFDEWERYLKIYMLKQIGKKTREIAQQFYERNEAPERQVLRDFSKAKKLIQNAVAENFPGKY